MVVHFQKIPNKIAHRQMYKARVKKLRIKLNRIWNLHKNLNLSTSGLDSPFWVAKI